MVNQDKVATRQLIGKWHERAQIDYSDLYMKEYIAYNAWFRKVTDTSNDSEAIKRVVQRFVLWDDYLQGRTLFGLKTIIEDISALTWKRPVRSTGFGWNGIVVDGSDWKGLIYFWYQTRCDLFHGTTLPGMALRDLQIKLAYESLNIFMTEIMRRMRYCFDDTDYARLIEVQRLIKSEGGPMESLREVELQLHQRFIHSPDIWNVDMARAQKMLYDAVHTKETAEWRHEILEK